ncbi:MAG TPA: TonB-dependent receptor [Steroidobacteraceae bacterium]|nr:TonB-dependent receptor [Steroidobacteraceae bacterium]
MALRSVSRGNSIVVAAALLGMSYSIFAVAAEETQQAVLQEVTVTATKVGETSAQSTPLTLSVFTADQLAQHAIDDITGVVNNTPGLSLTDLGGYSQLFIRGVGSNTVYVGSDPSSTIHIDGVYQARPLTFTTDFLDVDRVEVLKGPQGTLYGRNSVGGTVNVISRTPSDTLTGEALVSGGTYGEFGLQAYIAGPIDDSGIRGSLAVSRLTHSDYLSNISTGGNLENADHWAVRGQLLFPFGSKATLTVRGNYAYAADALGGDPKLLQPDGVPLDDSVLGNYFKISENGPGIAHSTLKLYGFNADFVYHPTNDLTIRSLTAYQSFNDSLGFDADSSSLNNIYTNETPVKQHQISEELNASGTAGPLTYVLGAYWFTENDSEPLYVVLPSFGVTDANQGKVVDESWAFYGQAEYHFTPKWSLLVGIRYIDETKDYDQSNIWRASASLDPDVVNSAPIVGPPFFPPPFTISTSRTDSAWTPKFSLNYRPEEDLLAYLSATKGFKSGGYDFGSPTAALATQGYNPEYLWDYELGVKSEWLGHRLRVNADVFYYDYTNMQVEVFVPPANAITQNAASSKIKGAELDVSARPIPQLDLHATVLYLNARYTSFPNAYVTAFGTFDATGQALNYAPDWSYALGATYIFNLFGHGSEFIGLDYTGQAIEYFTPANNGVAGTTGYAQQQGPYQILGARLGWNSSDSRWNLSLIGLNLTNRQYVTGTVNYTTVIAGRPGDPRTIRGQISYKF